MTKRMKQGSDFEEQKMHQKFINWVCYKIVMAWPGQMPTAKWFMWMLARAGWHADYPCEDCIGMKDHGCYCKAMNAIQPGGPRLTCSTSSFPYEKEQP